MKSTLKKKPNKFNYLGIKCSNLVMYIRLGSEMETTEWYISYQPDLEHLNFNNLLDILPYGLPHDYMHSVPLRTYKCLIR